LEEDAHVAAVADWLNQQASAQKIEHLVVVAPPRSLGELRRRYDKALTAVLVSELHHELVGRSGREVLAALQQG
jgi:protein required for attachment to host cells